MNRPTAFLLVVLFISAATAACGGGDGESSATQAPSPTATTAPVTTDTTGSDTTGTTDNGDNDGTTSTVVSPQPADPDWSMYEDDFYVWGVGAGDVLNVRLEPGARQPIVGELQPGARGIRRYDATRSVNEGSWGPVAVPGGVGWVNLAYLRPEGTRPPRIEGTPDPRTETAADDVKALLGAGEYEALSGFIDPARGLTISLYANVADDDVVLTPDQVAGAATDRTLFLWGYTDGEGRAVETTIRRRFRSIAGDPGLTSTDVIGYDTRIGQGNTIDNIAERFPGSHVVEYHFEGTSLYGDFDWSSVRFVFDTASPAPTGRPALLAIVQDTWTI